MVTVMQDHPAWATTPDGAVRVMRCGTTLWRLAFAVGPAAEVEATPLTADATARPVINRLALTCMEPSEIAEAVRTLGPVVRVHNSDLWDAIGTAIIRQVIRAGQARLMYRRFCVAHGPAITTPAGVHHLFPTPAAVLALTKADFAELGMAFKQAALMAAATAFREQHQSWERLDPLALVAALQAVPRIGPWTAGAAVADWSGDFSVYPYGDLAVRTWARRAAPGTPWPDDEPSFAAYWRDISSKDLSALTQLVLAWGGTHVRSP